MMSDVDTVKQTCDKACGGDAQNERWVQVEHNAGIVDAPTSKKATACTSQSALLTQPVFLVGFMGAGKTSVARRVARLCGIASIDTDTYIERKEGRMISDIFADEGEEAFRALETSVLHELAQKSPLLVSCGGGIVERAENRQALQEGGFVVYLTVSADEAARRIGEDPTRPLFSDFLGAQARLIHRLPLYEEVADVTIPTSQRSVYAIACELIDILKERGVLCPQPK